MIIKIAYFLRASKIIIDSAYPEISADNGIAFSQNINADGVCRGDAASAKASVCEMSVTVDEGRILLDVGMLVEAHASTLEKVKYVKDVYSTTHRVSCDYKSVEMPRYESFVNGNFTLSDSMTLDEAGISAECSVVDISGCVYPDTYSLNGGRCLVGGRVRFDLLLDRGGEYSSQSVELPLRYECAAPDHASDMGADALFEGEIISARARVDGERIGIDAEISMNGCAWEIEQTSLLDSVGFGDEIVRGVSEYTVCYPAKGESIWRVAKRYGAPIGAVVSTNKLPTDEGYDSARTLEKVKYVMI